MFIINCLLYCTRRAHGARTAQSSKKMMTNLSENGYIHEFGFMIPQFNLFSFDFWKKLKTPKRHFEIN